MAKRKEEQYVFDASARTVKIPGHIELHDLLLINNATRGVVIANQFEVGKKFTKSHTHPELGEDPDFPYSIDGVCTFILDYDTTSMSDDDELSIYIDDERHGLKVRPYDFGTDAIERIRVANPQSLIDADFEYGLQDTKWQGVGLNRNIPSFFELPSLPLTVSNIVSDGAAGFSNITVTVSAGEAISIDTPVSVLGTLNELAEGIFLVTTSNGSTSFTYKAKGFITAGTIYTTNVSIKKGGIFGSTTFNVAGVSTVAVGSTTFVTVDFTENHGLVPGSPIAVLDSTPGLQVHEGSFFVNKVPRGTRIVFDAGVNVGGISTGNLTVYGKNDANFIHRPFDGGVRISNFYPIHGLETKRQTKRYFRYQSGKGFFYSTGALLAPNYDIELLTYSNPYITVTTSDEHGLQPGATVRLTGVVSANYNGTYVVEEIVSSKVFKIIASSAPTVTPALLGDTGRLAVTKWTGCAVRAGMFDDSNGMFWEYDGKDLYVVRRSSTQQISGTVEVENGVRSVIGTNTLFTDQLDVGEKILIRGQVYLITSIDSDTALTTSPEYRGVGAVGVKISKIIDTRVPQSKFNYDRIDGSGPSGYRIDLNKMQMYALQYSWYGAGFIDYMIRGPLGEFITVHRFANNNVNTEAYMRSGNLPTRYEVSNFTSIGRLAQPTGFTTTSLVLNDVSPFPYPPSGKKNYVLVHSTNGGVSYDEIMSYTGLTTSTNTLTGVTTTSDYNLFLSGQTRNFIGVSSSQNHPTGSSVILLNTTCSPSISHWGAAVILDGEFNDDTGFLFSLARFNIVIPQNTTRTVLLFRPAPSVSNTIPGALGEREVINRSQTQFNSIAVNNISGRNVEIAGILNPSNSVGGTGFWLNANRTTVGVTTVFQPSFAQYNTTFTDIPTDGEVLFRFLSLSGTTNFDLTKIKEVQNSVIGGDNTFPDGPEVLALIVANQNNQSATLDISLRWTEAQA
jgi:hypothetical protein